ncbi:TIGR02556 family CRISPR-associated protein [Methanothermobacter sp.]|uniref:TIGR02556 family CRISPR-associated protein n=1 Tax=Methanothermobacter sp. TaxID=1884223 RepID=UPI0026276059|nr:TIGR02556 family CRISPR-associated protein [Methanothermobacter sp.]MDI9619142.1 TIGR02556 family CRISPR-associated protein [Methanothermobacter sp.]
MLEAVKELGEYLKTEDNIGGESVFIEAHKLSGVKHVICVVFNRDEGIYYHSTHTEQYDKAKNEKYLYRQFSHRRYDLVPTSKTPSPEKLSQRWTLWFATYASKQNNFWDSHLIESLYSAILKDDSISEDIIGDIERELNNIPKNERNNIIFTIKIRDGGVEKYLGEFKIFREIFVKESIKKFFTKHGTKSKGWGICSLCRKEKEVYGFASPFSVYTVDKRGFASNFVQENSWKQLPICEDCGVSLEIGKEFINKYLSKNFYSLAFYVIPHFIFGYVYEDVIDEIKDYEKRKHAKCLLSIEEDILDILKENKDFMNLIFVFYKKKKGDYFDIIKYVEDVSPSWIKILFEAFYGVNAPIFSENSLKRVMGEKWVGGLLEWSWNKKNEKMALGNLIRTFFPQGYEKYFIDTVGEILSQRPISMDFLISAFNREIRAAHVSDQNFKERLLCLKSLYLLRFLHDLNLLKVKRMEQRKEKRDFHLERLESFFEEFKGVFDSSQKKAVFLEGVLTKFLLDVQYAQRKSTPFRSKLKGLKLDQKDIKKLLPEIIEKLREYNVGYPWLERQLSIYLLEGENEGWRLSNDDISYYFALGLNLGELFKKEGAKNE